jgi:hypothetical protein
LLDEEALLAAAYGAATNFVAGVADGGIGVETGLLLAGFGGADFGFGLSQGGIGFGGEALGFFQGEEGRFGIFLGATEVRVDGLDDGDVHVVVLHFLGGHVHGLLGEGWECNKRKKQYEHGDTF